MKTLLAAVAFALLVALSIVYKPARAQAAAQIQQPEKPPRVNDGGPGYWLAEITKSAMPIYAGPCRIDELEIKSIHCRMFADPLRNLGYIVADGDPKSDMPTLIVLIENPDGKNKVTVAWCKPDYCPKGRI